MGGTQIVLTPWLPLRTWWNLAEHGPLSVSPTAILTVSLLTAANDQALWSQQQAITQFTLMPLGVVKS